MPAPMAIKEGLEISQVIRQRRKELGLSQEAIARTLDCSLSCVRHWEKGTHIPGKHQLEPLCNVLRLKPEDLVN